MNLNTILGVLPFVLTLAGCAGITAHPLAHGDASHLEQLATAPAALGTLIYNGDVRPQGADAEGAFRYERWVRDTGAGNVSTHLTYDLAGDGVVLHQATHDAAYTLTRFEELHGQTGLVGSVEVHPGGELSIEVTVDGETTRATEGPGAPVHAGPTLFGYVLNHWDGLVAGESLPLRFPVLSDARTYGFQVRLDHADREHTVFRMDATHLLVRAVVPTMRLTFATETREPVRYEGSVPPLLDDDGRLRAFQARVDYTMSQEYR
ncbi:MAG: hypothetical protein ACI8PZ_003227 [Myxococcota bacterium]|jgi:hypothetical protein